MQEDAQTASSEVEDAQLPYIILPNGKKRFTRATRVDIIVSLLLPIIGISVAHGAYSIGENRRAGEMLRASVISVLAIVFLCN